MDTSSRPGAGDIRVFVIDDHGVVRDSVRIACEQRPGLVFVGGAQDGYEGVRAIELLQPEVAVIDVVLPGIDGFEVVRRLRARGFAGKTLILTSRGDQLAPFEASVLGVDGFIRKTASLDQVADAIERVASGDRVFAKEEQRQAIAQLGVVARRTRQASQLTSALTSRENDVLRLLAEGISSRQIATRLDISERTVESHISNVYRKLGVGSRVQAVRKASALGLLDAKASD